MAGPTQQNTQNQDFSNISTEKYYTNCRGVNYLPIMNSEWKKSGYLPRYPAASVFGILNPSLAYDTSNSFQGTNKTAQWWYYNHDDNEHCVSLLRDIGINSIRVFTDMYVWGRRREQFLTDIKDFMKICDKYKVRVQLVLWDGIFIPINSAPESRADTFSSVEAGLLVNWRRVPHDFEMSSAAQLTNFFSTCATPFINDLCSSLSSFQSLWSFDLNNEDPRTYASALMASSSRLVSSNLSSIHIGITFGHGNDYAPYSATLTNGNGFYDGWPNEIFRASSLINFASIHPYATNNRMITDQYVRDTVSGADMLGIPGMYNEGGNADMGNWIYQNLAWFNKRGNVGGMLFDGFVDFAMSYEPFRDLQGVLFWDGTTRNSLELSGYVDLALHHGWLRPSQLRRTYEQKEVSEDDGADGGYYSGVVPWHASYNTTDYVSATQAQWEATKTYFYTTLPAIGSLRNEGSKNYTPYPGHPVSPSLEHSYIASGFELRDYLDICSNYSTYFSSLSAIPDASNGDYFLEKNRQLVLRDLVLYRASFFTMNTNPLTVWAELTGSQYDFLPASALRLSFSSTYFSGSRGDGSSILLGYNSKLSTITSANWLCVATSSCLYNTPGVPDSGIDWEAYDIWYNSCFDKLNQYIEVLEDSGDDRYVLY
jgi:hypothetical protein